MKLENLGHAQDEQTRIKIGVAVRLRCNNRREKLMLQETCRYEWQNLIAVASRKGLLGEEELQWDSYKILNEQYEQEWSETIEQRKKIARPKGSKRDPKSDEQKRKISEAISAKWLDPAYRNRVQSGLAKYYGIPEGVERKPSKKSSGKGQPRKNEIDLTEIETVKKQINHSRYKRARMPLYKDPLVSSKFQMLKNIKAQRDAAANGKGEAITKAKLLIVEAETAAKALESAASNSSVARASLTESRMLIAEAIQLIEHVEKGALLFEKDNDISEALVKLVPSAAEELEVHSEILDTDNNRKANGVPSLSKIDYETDNLSFNNFVLSNLVAGNSLNSSLDDILGSSDGLLLLDLTNVEKQPNFSKNAPGSKPNPNERRRHEEKLKINGLEVPCLEMESTQKENSMSKKWVRGRLIEVGQE